MRPEDFDGERPERPEGEREFPGFGERGGRDGERPEMPPEEGGQPPEMGERPALPDFEDMTEMPDFEDMPGMQEGFPEAGSDATGESSTEFYMSDKVNSFSGVKDAQ